MNNSEQNKAAAVDYLYRRLQESNHNDDKPVFLHSLRVGLLLEQLGYDSDTVITGFLHDLIEDTATSKEEISLLFGDKISGMVSANSFNYEIQKTCDCVRGKTARHRDCFERCLALGKGALAVKAADLYSNSFFYLRNERDSITFRYLVDRLQEFITLSQDVLGNCKLVDLLQERYQILSQE